MLAEVMVLPTRPSIISYVRLGAAVSWGGPELLLPSSLEHCDTDIPPGTRKNIQCGVAVGCRHHRHGVWPANR